MGEGGTIGPDTGRAVQVAFAHETSSDEVQQKKVRKHRKRSFQHVGIAAVDCSGEPQAAVRSGM